MDENLSNVHQQYKHTLTGILGQKRSTMLDSELQYTARLAQRKMRPMKCWPGVDYNYGVSYPPKTESVALALLSWPGMTSKANASSKNLLAPANPCRTDLLPRDFITLNKGAVDMGAVKPEGFKAYRSMYDKRVKTKECKLFLKKKTLHEIPDIVFGVSTRPGTPINEIIENRYAKCSIEKLLQEERCQKKEIKLQNEVKQIPGSYKDTRTSILRRHVEKVAEKPYWHMPKFEKKAKPHLDSFWSDTCLNAAAKNSKEDSVARWGRFRDHRTGIYAPAIN